MQYFCVCKNQHEMHFLCTVEACMSEAWRWSWFVLCWRWGVGFLCVGGPHMASVGRGSDDGQEEWETERERDGEDTERRKSSNLKRSGWWRKKNCRANRWKENDWATQRGESRGSSEGGETNSGWDDSEKRSDNTGKKDQTEKKVFPCFILNSHHAHLTKRSPWIGRCQIHWPAGDSRTGPGRWSPATGPRTAAGSGDLWGGGGANASVVSSRPRGSSGSLAETAGTATSCYGGQSGCRRSPPCFWGVFLQGSRKIKDGR